MNLAETSVIRISDQTFGVAAGTSMAADIDLTGAIVISAQDSVFPHATIESPLGPLEVWLALQGDGTGVINPLTGEGSAQAAISANFGSPLPDGCNIGPVTLTLTAEVPYDMTTGGVTLSQVAFSVPAADPTGPCGFIAAAVLNGYLGLPTSNTEVHFIATVDPIVTGS
jgi:hypothetical protein